MKYIKPRKIFENSNIASIMSDEKYAINYLKSIDFFDSHGYDEYDEVILDNVSDLVYRYRWLKKEYVTIYRALNVPTFDDIDLTQVGYFWSFERKGVGTYDSGLLNIFNKKWIHEEVNEIILTATTHKANINWLESLVANAIYGDEQSECYLNKNSNIEITHINDNKLNKKIKAKI